MKSGSTKETKSPMLPLYLLYGDEFLVKEELNNIISSALGADLRKTNLIVLNGADLDEEKLFSLVATPSLFGDARVIVVEDTTLFASPKDAGRLAARVAEATRSGDKKTVLRCIGQLLGLLGAANEAAIRSDEWLAALATEKLSSDTHAVLREAAREWLESGQKLNAPQRESLVQDLVRRPIPEGTIVVFTADAVDSKKPSFRAFQEHGHVRECLAARDKFAPRLNRSFFESRVKAILGEAGKTISRDALNRIYARAGTDLRRLQGELHKLLNYVGERRRIETADVESVFEDFHATEFYEFGAAIRTGDLHKCLISLHEHLRIAAHPLQTLAAISGEVRRLLMAKELKQTVFADTWRPGISFATFKNLLADKERKDQSPDAAARIAKTGMKPYLLYVSLEASDKFSEKKLIAAMEKLLQADIILKSSRLGRYGAQAILEDILFHLCHRS
ncbi:MAG: DNA polymerase III subunit delta [Desulfomonilaceae bacterium]